jgi:nicotinamidase-related amidase
MVKNSKKSALLVIDTQIGLFERPTPVFRADEFLKAIGSLIARARKAGIPVVFIQHENTGTLKADSATWRLHPGLDARDEDLFIRKKHGNSFQETQLDAELKKRGINRVIITGMVTNHCVRDGCLGAKELGYEVTLAGDGHSNSAKEAARVIKEINAEIAGEGIAVLPAAEIAF